MGGFKLFSQRKTTPADRYSYELSERVRSRILSTLLERDGMRLPVGLFRLGRLLEQVARTIMSKVGGLRGTATGQMADMAQKHFFSCTNDESLDFIELLFRCDEMHGLNPFSMSMVAAVNQIFEDEGLGYELTQFRDVDTGEPAYLFGRLTGGNLLVTQFPLVIQKNERTVHESAVKPALEVLHDPRFATANGELMDAFQKVREGKYADAITSCGAAFESVMKTVCNIKGWSYDPKDTCAKLIKVCKDQSLFFPFYAPIFEGIGTVRNNLGDAHGKGPTPVHVASKEHAENMIAVTCAHITFLVRSAGI